MRCGNGQWLTSKAPSKRAHNRFGLAKAESIRVQLPPQATPYPKLHTKMSACCSARMLCLPARPRLFSALLHREGLQSAVIPSFGRRARQPAQHTSPVFALSMTQSPSPRTSPLFVLSQRLLPYRPYRCCTVNPLPVYDRHVFLFELLLSPRIRPFLRAQSALHHCYTSSREGTRSMHLPPSASFISHHDRCLQCFECIQCNDSIPSRSNRADHTGIGRIRRPIAAY